MTRALEQQLADVKIMQRVNRVHREAFAEKFPGQCEHCLRLVMERLQAGLDKRDGVDPSRPETWRMSTAEIADLAEAANQLNQIRQGF
jgi:hypothetical protein